MKKLILKITSFAMAVLMTMSSCVMNEEFASKFRDLCYIVDELDSKRESSNGFALTAIATATYYIKNRSTGTYLNVKQGVDAENQGIDTTSFKDSDSMKWKVYGSSSSKVYQFRPLCSDTRYLNQCDSTASVNVEVNIVETTDDFSQWYLEAVDGAFYTENGGYVIRNYSNPLYVLDMNGSDVCVNIYSETSETQVWQFTPVDLVYPEMSFDKTRYCSGDKVTISWEATPSSSNLSHYWIRIFLPDGTDYLNRSMGSKTSYSFTPPAIGEYKVFVSVTPVGSPNGENSLIDRESFYVYNDDFLGVKWSDTDNDLEYPIYSETEFAQLLKYWVESDKNGIATVLEPYLEEHTYSELLNMTIDVPVATEDGKGYSIEGSATVKEVMAYLLFADATQKYMSDVLNEVKDRINNNETYYEYFLDHIKNFNTQFFYFQEQLNGKDTFNQTLQSLLLAKTAMSIVNELKITYKSGGSDHIVINGSGKTIDEVIQQYKTEDVTSVIQLKSYSYFTDMYKTTVEETPQLYDDLRYYILSGGDTSRLNDYYQDVLEWYGTEIKNVKEIFKIAKDPQGLPDETDDLIGLFLDNLTYWSDKYDTEHSDEIKTAKEIWGWAEKGKDLVKAISNCSLLGVVTATYDISKSYIEEVQKVYDKAADSEAGWYAITYYYLEKENPALLKAIIDSDTGNAEISINRLIQYGFPVDNSDIIQSDIARYYERHAYLNYTYTPDEDFRLYLWNACNTINSIESIDCCEYRDMLLSYIVAELNYQNDIIGVQLTVSATSSDYTLGKTSGSGAYSTKDTATVTATPYENVTFIGWADPNSGEIISTEAQYTFSIYKSVALEAQFAGGNVETATAPTITNQPTSSSYYAGQEANALTLTATNSDGGEISIEWYKSDANKNYGGTLVGKGASYTPFTESTGTTYYYAIVTNTLNYAVGTEITTTTAKKCSNVVKITVGNPILTSIELVSTPDKMFYDEYEVFDSTGMIINAVYSDKSTYPIDDYTVGGFDNTILGSQEITVTYYGRTVTFDIEIVEHKHTYTSTIVPPTYYNQGYTLHDCDNCDYSYKDNYQDKLILPAISDLALKSRNYNSITLSWDKNASASGYIIQQYKNNAWVNIANIKDNTVTSYQIANLAANTNYKFRAVAYVTNGESTAYSSYTSALTISTAPAMNANFAITGRGSDFLTITWTKNAGASGYIIQEQVDGVWKNVASIKGNATTSYTVANLQPNSFHRYRMVAYKTDANGTCYGKYTGSAPGYTAPAMVSGFKVSNIGADSLTVSWDKVTSANGYVIDIYRDGKWSQLAKINSNATTSYKASGLTLGTTYKFRIKSYATNGTLTINSTYSSAISGVPTLSKVTNLRMTNRGTDFISVRWDKNESADGYMVYIYDGTKWTCVKTLTTASSVSHKITGLESGKAYKVTVKAYKTVNGKKFISDTATISANTL